MRNWLLLSLRARLIFGFLLILLIGQLGFSYLRSTVVRMDYERTMLALAADNFAHQAEAILANPDVELPAKTARRFQRVDRIWRTSKNVFVGLDPGSDPYVVGKISEALVAKDVVPNALFADFAPSTKFDHVEGGGGNRYRGPVPPMETLIAARLDGSDAWITARIRGGPPPPPVTGKDIILNIGIVLILGLLGIFLLLRELGGALSSLRRTAEQFGPRGPVEEAELVGPKEFYPVAQSFNAMRSQIQHLLREKDVMLGAIGHDLRTPLTSLRLTLEDMGPEDARDRAIATIDSAGGVLDDILELARADSAELPDTPYDIAALLEDVVVDTQERGEDVTFKSAGRVTMKCRPGSLRRMAQNLIGNAVKYAGQARITLSETDGKVQILVEDDGPGLPDDLLEHVLEPFARAETSRNASIGGTGLGLTLARAVARNHGGTLDIANRSPKGLLVRVVMPTGVAKADGSNNR